VVDRVAMGAHGERRLDMIGIIYTGSLIFPVIATIIAVRYFCKFRLLRAIAASTAAVILSIFISGISVYMALGFSSRLQEMHNPGAGVAYVPLVLVAVFCIFSVIVSHLLLYFYRSPRG